MDWREVHYAPPRLKRVCCWAGQTPGHARGAIIKLDRTTDAALHHPFNNDSSEPAVLRRGYRRSLALSPAHGERVGIGRPPGDIDPTPVRRERPVFSGISSKLVEREPDGLRRSRIQTQPRTLPGNARTDEVAKMRELGTNEIRDLHPRPFVAYEQVLIG